MSELAHRLGLAALFLFSVGCFLFGFGCWINGDDEAHGLRYLCVGTLLVLLGIYATSIYFTLTH